MRHRSGSARTLVWFALAGALMGGCDCNPLPTPKPQAQRGPFAVLFHLDGDLPAFPSTAGLLSGPTLSQHRLQELLDRASRDLSVQEIVIHFGTIENLAFGRAHELAQTIARASQSGKKITCHIESADNLTYMIAAAGCPSISISPAGSVDIIGLAMQTVYLKDLLDKAGVRADITHVGRYKDAAEPLLRNEMSESARQASESLLGDLQTQLVESIAKGRGLEPAQVRSLMDSAPYGAEEAVEKGLADEARALGVYIAELVAKYPGGVTDEYGKEPAKSLSITDLFGMLSGAEPKKSKITQPSVALIIAQGPISSGKQDSPFAASEMVTDVELTDTLLEAGIEPNIKAVVLRVDSPGGSPLASDNIWHVIKDVSKRKPVLVSMGDVAASGGYYIATAADEIFADPQTLTGSIGVVGGKIVFAETARKLGVHPHIIPTAKRSAMLSPFEPFDEGEQEAIRELMERTYALFVDRVVEGRDMNRDAVLAVAEGRVWTGAQALEHGLVDTLGTLGQAIDRAREKAGLPAGAPVEILPRPKSIMELFSEAFGGPDSAELRLLSKSRALSQAYAFRELLARDAVLTFSPVVFELR